MDEAKIRAWWAHKQGLDGSFAGSEPALVLESTGWARSVGGAAPYLTLWARAPVSRQAVDSAVADLEIHELPAVNISVGQLWMHSRTGRHSHRAGVPHLVDFGRPQPMSSSFRGETRIPWQSPKSR